VRDVINIEQPVFIEGGMCTEIRTHTLEDAEAVAGGLNKLKIGLYVVKAGLHPDSQIKHKKPF
jgi:hypothetical protein